MQTKTTNFEKYTNKVTNTNFNLVFDSTSFNNRQNQVDIIVYKNGGMITDQSLSIPSYFVCVNKHKLNQFEHCKVIAKQYNQFDQAINLYNDLIIKYQNTGFEKSSHIDRSKVKQFWNGYFERSVTYRTKQVSDKLIDNIVFAISDVVDKVAVNYIQQYREQITSIINQLGTAKVNLRNIKDKTTYNSGYMLFNNMFNKWLAIESELSKTNPIFGNINVAICDKNVLDNVTHAFRLYSNYSDRYR